MSDAWPQGFASLRQWRLRNFKSVADSAIDLAPLTVLIGANSSGKSSLLQSMLAVVQATESSGEAFPLNGPLVRLGSYQETVSAFEPEPGPPISIGGRFVLPLDEAQFAYDTIAAGVPSGVMSRRGLRALGLQAAATRLLKAGRSSDEGVALDWTAEFCRAPSDEPGSTLLERCVIQVTKDGRVLAALRAERTADMSEPGQQSPSGREARGGVEYSMSYHGSVQSSTAEPLAIAALSVRGGLPVGALIQMDEVERRARQWLDAAALLAISETSSTRSRHRQEAPEATDGGLQSRLNQLTDLIADHVGGLVTETKANSVPEDFHVTSQFLNRIREISPQTKLLPIDLNLLPHSEELVAAVKDKLGPRRTLLVEPDQPSMLREVAWEALTFMRRRVLYLGPLREDPQVVHKARPEAREGFIGVKGEYSAAALHAARHQLVDAPVPGGDTVARRSLGEAVNDWAAFLGVGESFTTADRGRLGLDLRVRDRDIASELDLTSVGTGVSQLLPVLVMCLLAPKGSLLLIEQPELHLHPAIQHKLADFLLAVARSGRQLIVETHSEYLVARLRRRMAEDTTDATRAFLAFVFAERERGKTTYRSVKPTPYGGFEEWPDGFLDQTTTESRALLRAGVAKRRIRQAREQRQPEPSGEP